MLKKDDDSSCSAFIGVFLLSIIWTDLIFTKVKTVTIIDFTFEIVRITAIRYLLLKLMGTTIVELYEELENKDQLERIKKMLEAV